MNEAIKTDFFSLNQCLFNDFSFPLFFGVILLAVLFGLDVATTNMILLLGGYEQNTIMALIIDYPVVHIAIKGFVIIFIALVVQFSECKIKGSGLCALCVIIFIYSFVIFNNVTVMKNLAGI
jgi:hypothetical protein